MEEQELGDVVGLPEEDEGAEEEEECCCGEETLKDCGEVEGGGWGGWRGL